MGLDHTTYLAVFVLVDANQLKDQASFTNSPDTTLADYLQVHCPIPNAKWRNGSIEDVNTGDILLKKCNPDGDLEMEAHLVYKVERLDQYKLRPADRWVCLDKYDMDKVSVLFNHWDLNAHAWSYGVRD